LCSAALNCLRALGATHHSNINFTDDMSGRLHTKRRKTVTDFGLSDRHQSLQLLAA
jgi:hypothetical protein